MQNQSPKKSIFQTQPKFQIPSYQNSLKEIKNYTFNLNHHLNEAISKQDKAINRRKYELEKELQYLREKHYEQRKRIRQMEQYFHKYCQNPLNSEITKWNQHQNYFHQILQYYQHEIQTQTLINDKNRKKIALLRQQLKQQMRQQLKQSVTERLELYHLSKSKNFRTKKSFSTISQKKTTKMNTETTQNGDIGDFKFHNKYQRYTEQDEHETENPPSNQSQQIIVRSKTNTTLPVLKRSVFLDPIRIKNDECNFMKPIGTVKKSYESESNLLQIIRFLQQYKLKSQQYSGTQIDWFEKVVFNNRNFDKLITTLSQQFRKISSSKYSLDKSSTKVKEIVAKNLFRLKTESTVQSYQLKQIHNYQIKNKKKIIKYVKNASQSERMMK